MNHIYERNLSATIPALKVLLIAALSLGCAAYQGTAKDVEPAHAMRSGNWIVAPRVPLVVQQANHDCGAAALTAVLRYWGHSTSPDRVVAAKVLLA